MKINFAWMLFTFTCCQHSFGSRDTHVQGGSEAISSLRINLMLRSTGKEENSHDHIPFNFTQLRKPCRSGNSLIKMPTHFLSLSSWSGRPIQVRRYPVNSSQGGKLTHLLTYHPAGNKATCFIRIAAEYSLSFAKSNHAETIAVKQPKK